MKLQTLLTSLLLVLLAAGPTALIGCGSYEHTRARSDNRVVKHYTAHKGYCTHERTAALDRATQVQPGEHHHRYGNTQRRYHFHPTD